MTKDKRKGVLAGYRKLGPTARFIFRATIAAVVLTVVGFFLGFFSSEYYAAVVPTVVGFLIGIFSSEYYYARSQRAARHLTNIIMPRPVPFVRKFPVIIEDGSNTQEIPAPGRYRPAISLCPFSFFITPDGSINLRGEIRDAKGAIVAEAIGDSVRAIQAKRYDVNSDKKAIEIVDINKQPVFQLMVIPFEDFIKEITERRSKLEGKMHRQKAVENSIMLLEKVKQRMTEKRRKKEIDELIEKLKKIEKFDVIEELKKKGLDEVIRLSYITQQGETWLISSTHGLRSVESLGENKKSLIPRLFCYPGYSYPGKRVDQ